MALANSTPEEKKRAAEYQKLYRLRNGDKVRATANASYKRNFEADPSKFRERNSKWRDNNPERMQEFREAWLDKGENREKTRVHNAMKQAERRREHPDVVRESLKKWRLKNQDAIKRYQREWRQKNKVDRAIYQRARQAKVIGVKIDKTKIFNWESRICPLCTLLIEGSFHVDHKVPLSKGGLHEVENLQLTHPFCNLSKRDKLVT